MKDFWEEPEVKKVNKKKVIIISAIAVLLAVSAIITTIYIKNIPFREWFDKNIFRKEINQDKLTSIEIKEGDDPAVYAFNQYIGILNKNEFKIYNNTGKEEKKLNIEITNPLVDESNRYLVVGENKGKKLYLITDKDITWENEVEGNISQVHVNKNGYVAVTVTDTSHKTVVIMYDNEGNALFKTFLSYTRVSDIAISNDSKYLAIAEIDTSGTMIRSNIKVISVEKAKAKTDSENSIIASYQGENNDLITNIKYQDKNRLICMYTDKIKSIAMDGSTEIISENLDKKITFSAIELNNHIATIEEKSSGLFTADSVVSLVNTENKSIVNYSADAVAKEVYASGDIVALNLGTQVEFINTGGWLVKRYKSNQEVTNITLAGNIAGIIYRDRVEIINL